MNFTVIVLSGIDRNLSIALSVSSAWNPPFIRLLGPPLRYVANSVPDMNIILTRFLCRSLSDRLVAQMYKALPLRTF